MCGVMKKLLIFFLVLFVSVSTALAENEQGLLFHETFDNTDSIAKNNGTLTFTPVFKKSPGNHSRKIFS
jgi:hypothetical protein